MPSSAAEGDLGEEVGRRGPELAGAIATGSAIGRTATDLCTPSCAVANVSPAKDGGGERLFFGKAATAVDDAGIAARGAPEVPRGIWRAATLSLRKHLGSRAFGRAFRMFERTSHEATTGN